MAQIKTTKPRISRQRMISNEIKGNPFLTSYKELIESPMKCIKILFLDKLFFIWHLYLQLQWVCFKIIALCSKPDA